MSEILKATTRNQKNPSAFFVNVFWCKTTSWSLFHNHDTSSLIYVIFHVEKTFMIIHCKVCGRYFKRKVRKTEHLQKKHQFVYGSQSNISTFLKYIWKYKTQTNECFSYYCDSSVESLRLSALCEWPTTCFFFYIYKGTLHFIVVLWNFFPEGEMRFSSSC